MVQPCLVVLHVALSVCQLSMVTFHSQCNAKTKISKISFTRATRDSCCNIAAASLCWLQRRTCHATCAPDSDGSSRLYDRYLGILACQRNENPSIMKIARCVVGSKGYKCVGFVPPKSRKKPASLIAISYLMQLLKTKKRHVLWSCSPNVWYWWYLSRNVGSRANGNLNSPREKHRVRGFFSLESNADRLLSKTYTEYTGNVKNREAWHWIYTDCSRI